MRLPHDGVALVVGVRGSGKSTWAREHLLADAERALVFDPHGEYASDADVALSPDELADYVGAGHELPPIVAVVPRDFTPAALRDAFAVFSDVCTSGAVVDTLILIDEVALLRRAPDLVDGLVTQSRHWGCPVGLVSQRAAAVPKTSRGQASVIVSFAQRDPDDIDALVEITGHDARAVSTYSRFQFFQWTADAVLEGPAEIQNK